MAQGETPITLVGNLVADPELRYTPNGAAVANFRVATTPRRYDSQSGQYVDGEPLFMTCSLWKQAAENLANSLTKGQRVIVTGVLKQRRFDNKQGQQQTVFEVQAEEVGPSLKFATAQVTKTSRNNPAGGGWSQQQSSQQYGNNQQQSDPWNSNAPSDDNPPF